MTGQMLFYESAVPVRVDKHRDLYVKTGASYAFASKVNSVPLTAAEFAEAAAEYPIVFAGDETTVMPAVILGATATSNVFVSESGDWGGKYIPAFVRRYPFVFAQDASGKNLILHIDESFEGCNTEGRGERLFDSEGQQTQYLQSVLRFLQDYQARFQRTQTYCQRLKEYDLLRPMQAQFTLPSGERRSLSGFMTVDRDKLKTLSGEQLEQLARTDELECTYIHLSSLRHFGAIAERSQTEAVDGATGEKPAPSALNGDGSADPSRDPEEVGV